ncbi:AAA family ATPase [Oscillatoria sp. FACHB-1406]|uniref:AAA family ATPase n=1 Tax=Oscillatoria sp. FACHB-1406 TaxID=2692846 RepID=UPI001684A696|nr:AAA family ATPase [Oscillatoria sp. FACHB-1406]MBD2576596.1 AAA family ATPase [Oscillatoria sp. FACHB-1406]
MKLLSLRLCNFRQFYGTTPEIVLASGERNTTVFHGNNGAGKTTILNAFTWILYDRFTAAFASPKQLINKRALSELSFGTSLECWAEIRFEHERVQYQVKRYCYAYPNAENRIDCSTPLLSMLYAREEDGRWYIPSEQPADIIQGILPESLHQYFFFDGERIDRIFREEGKKGSIAEDTKELLGVTVLDRAIEHLKKAKRALQEELKDIGDAQTKQLLREVGKLEAERDRILQRQQKMEAELQNYEELKAVLNQQLLAVSGAQDLQKLKQELEAQESTARQNLIEIKTQLKRAISSRGYTPLLRDAIAQFQALLVELRAKGELPSGIKKQFLQQLLERGRCLCGTELTEGSFAAESIKAWWDKAGMAEVEEATIRLETRTSQMQEQVVEFWEEMDRQQLEWARSREQLSDTENRLEAIRQKLRTYPDTDIQALQKRADDTETNIRHLMLERGGQNQQLEQLKSQIEEKNKQIAKHQLKEDKQILAQRRIHATEDAIARLTEVRSRLERQFRLSLEQRVQEIFSEISFTPYFLRLSENYELTLLENTSGIAVPVAASTGENQILSLSFIGGIIDRVRAWSQNQSNALMAPDSSTFPIVMDSPFGSLDEIYRRQVAKIVPQLANQLAILVTKTQWRGEVEREVASYIGREYVLVYYSPKPDCEEDAIERHGKVYPLVRRSENQFEYTEVIAIEPHQEEADF